MAKSNAKPKGNKWLNYVTVGARILLGLIFFVFGFGYFFMEIPPADTTTAAGQYMAGLLAAGYFLPFLKVVEGIAGFMLFFKRWTPLSLLILAPIVIQILLYAAFLDQAGLIMSVVMTALLGFLAWRNWDKYAGLFRA